VRETSNGSKQYKIWDGGETRTVFYDYRNAPYAAAIEKFNAARNPELAKKLVSPVVPSLTARRLPESSRVLFPENTVPESEPSYPSQPGSSVAVVELQHNSSSELDDLEDDVPVRDVKALRALHTGSPSSIKGVKRGKGRSRSSPVPAIKSRFSGRLRNRGIPSDDVDPDQIRHRGESTDEDEDEQPLPKKKKGEVQLSSIGSGNLFNFIDNQIHFKQLFL
jgi:hypothetical protein